MGKKTGIFTEGQLVYAKVKGYSPWPAKVSYETFVNGFYKTSSKPGKSSKLLMVKISPQRSYSNSKKL